MRRFILSATLGLVLAGSQSALGFDGSRKGFVLGLGAGLGGVHNDHAIGTERKLAVKGDFLIGAGFSNQFAMHFTTKTLFYDSDLHDLFLTDNLHSTILGLGFTYFTEEEAPATFMTGVIGRLTIGTQGSSFFADDDEVLASGFGVGIGVGREFSKHWLVGIDGFWGRPKDDLDPERESGLHNFGPNSFGLGVHVSYLFY